MPQLYNPESGFIATANNKIVPDDYPYFISQEWAPDYRVKRIRELFSELLSEGQRLTVSNMKAMQLDQVSLMARALLPYLVQLKPLSVRERQALEYLQPWTADMNIHKVAPSIFNAWSLEILRDFLAEEIEDDALLEEFSSGRYPIFCMEHLIEKFSNWADDKGEITQPEAHELLLTTFSRAMDQLESELGKDMDFYGNGESCIIYIMLIHLLIRLHG